ncbi:MAG: glycosyltransferase family 2 protein [Bacteroidales bacterium]|nr:glycosyltransferase family 2 protein [Bacteroidales bacterium]
MGTKINAFLPYVGGSQDEFVKELEASELVKTIFLVTKEDVAMPTAKCQKLELSNMVSSASVKAIAEKSDADYSMIITKEVSISFGYFAIERFEYIASSSNAGIVYSNYSDSVDGKLSKHPVIAYQAGSLRDDFNFGPMMFVNAEALKEAAANFTEEFDHAGIYSMRLSISNNWDLEHAAEFLYSQTEVDTRNSGKKIFDYVDPANRGVQIEMEKAVTKYLKEAGAYLEPKFEEISLEGGSFPVEASVVIPVLNRARTIEDAMRSVMVQKTDFDFNLIVVDNHSTDGTTEIIEKLVKEFGSDKIVHVTPERRDLGIGGCWNYGVHQDECGKFAVQLDSDDVYTQDGETLTKMVAAFYKDNAAMVVGSYTITDADLNEIPPGLIDHKEWTPENGRNNALRINGLGAPRAFYTPFLRDIKIPNVNYGEDYGLGLSVSRNYQIGRVYDSVYLVRRWDDNSDANVSIEGMNAHNVYKDRLRTYEFKARIKKNKQA